MQVFQRAYSTERVESDTSKRETMSSPGTFFETPDPVGRWLGKKSFSLGAFNIIVLILTYLAEGRCSCFNDPR